MAAAAPALSPRQNVFRRYAACGHVLAGVAWQAGDAPDRHIPPHSRTFTWDRTQRFRPDRHFPLHFRTFARDRMDRLPLAIPPHHHPDRHFPLHSRTFPANRAGTGHDEP